MFTRPNPSLVELSENELRASFVLNVSPYMYSLQCSEILNFQRSVSKIIFTKIDTFFASLVKVTFLLILYYFFLQLGNLLRFIDTIRQSKYYIVHIISIQCFRCVKRKFSLSSFVFHVGPISPRLLAETTTFSCSSPNSCL